MVGLGVTKLVISRGHHKSMTPRTSSRVLKAYIGGGGFAITLKGTLKSILIKGSFDPNWVMDYGAVFFPYTPTMYDIAEKCYRYDFFLLFLKIVPIQSFLFWKIITAFIEVFLFYF